MSKTSIIRHLADSSLIIIREDYVIICKDSPDAHCAAAILNQFEYWDSVKRGHKSQAQFRNDLDLEYDMQPTQDDSLWVYKTRDELKKELLDLFGDTKIQNCLTWLRDVQYLLWRNNPVHGYDRTLQYQLNAPLIQSKIDSIPTDARVKSNPSKGYKQPFHSRKNNPAIPENTTENTNKEKNTPIPPEGDSQQLLFDLHDEQLNGNGKPKGDTALDEMKLAVKKYLKQYNPSQQKNVAMCLLRTLKGKQADFNIEGEPLRPEQLADFVQWWDTSKLKDGVPITRPKNLGSVKQWVDAWRDAKQAIISPDNTAALGDWDNFGN